MTFDPIVDYLLRRHCAHPHSTFHDLIGNVVHAPFRSGAKLKSWNFPSWSQLGAVKSRRSFHKVKRALHNQDLDYLADFAPCPPLYAQYAICNFTKNNLTLIKTTNFIITHPIPSHRLFQSTQYIFPTWTSASAFFFRNGSKWISCRHDLASHRSPQTHET